MAREYHVIAASRSSSVVVLYHHTSMLLVFMRISNIPYLGITFASVKIPAISSYNPIFTLALKHLVFIESLDAIYISYGLGSKVIANPFGLWSPERHALYSVAHKQCVMTLMLLQRFEEARGLLYIPNELLFLIIQDILLPSGPTKPILDGVNNLEPYSCLY